MNKKLIIANWKMNLNYEESGRLAEEILNQSKDVLTDKVEVVICPSFESIVTVLEKITGSEIMLGAQNCAWEETGSFTGEVSPKILKELGVKYIIIGHSERREHIGETDEQVNKKVHAVLRQEIIPIICVGETFDQRSDGNKDFIIMQQVIKALKGVKFLNDDQIIIAYEPVWVIGSGQAVKPDEAEHTCQVIRQGLLDHYSLDEINQRVKIIYGGSINPDNIASFNEKSIISGYLIGGASLKADTFVPLIKEY